MTNAVLQTKSLDVQKEVLDLKEYSNRIFALKGLVTLTAIVLGIAAVIFLHIAFFPFAIGLLIVSGIYLYHLVQECRRVNGIYNRAAEAIANSK